MTEREKKFRDATKTIMKDALDNVDKADNFEIFIDGIIGALLGIKIFIHDKKNK